MVNEANEAEIIKSSKIKDAFRISIISGVSG